MTSDIDGGGYCRDIESYLCRKNDGHLIRIVGPAFGLVCGWAEHGIPLKVVYSAIDRVSERRDAKGGRRRPTRIEFCEREVLDRFDDWRRAVGVRSAADSEATRSRPRRSLKTHVAQVIERLTTWADRDDVPSGATAPLSHALDELGVILDRSGTARGSAREQLMGRLAEIQRRLVASLRDAADAPLYQRLRIEATRDLEPFRTRMPPPAFEESVEAATLRLFCEHMKLPRITHE